MIRRLLSAAVLAVTLAGAVLAQSVMIPGPGRATFGFPTLVLDSNGKGAQAQPTVASPYQYSFTPTNPPSKVFVGVQYYDVTGSINSVTYGGQAMTSLGSAIVISANSYLQVYELASPSTTGTATVQVNVSEDFTGMGVSVISFTGGDSSTASRANNTATSTGASSITITQSSAVGDIVIMFGGMDSSSNTLTYTSGTRVGTDTAIYSQSLRTTAQNAGAASTTITATTSFDRWAAWSVSVKGN